MNIQIQELDMRGKGTMHAAIRSRLMYLLLAWSKSIECNLYSCSCMRKPFSEWDRKALIWGNV